MTISTYYSAIYRQIETGAQITLVSSEQPLPVSLIGEAIELRDGRAGVQGFVASYLAAINVATAATGHTNRTITHTYEIARRLSPPADAAEQVARAIAGFASSKGSAQASTIWSERVTARNPVGSRIALRTGQLLAWSPAKGGEGTMLVGPMSTMPPYPDSREAYLAIDFTAVAGRNYVLAVETVGSGGEAQLVFLAQAQGAVFGDLRVQRPTNATIGISDPVDPEAAGPATVFFGLDTQEDEIIAAEVHEVQL